MSSNKRRIVIGQYPNGDIKLISDEMQTMLLLILQGQVIDLQRFGQRYLRQQILMRKRKMKVIRISIASFRRKVGQFVDLYKSHPIIHTKK